MTGASGFLGWNLYKQRPPNVEWLGTYGHNKIQLPGVELFHLNLLKEKDIYALLNQLKPDVVIHTAAISDAHWCETHPEQSEAINVVGSIMLAKACAEQEAQMVFVSTDLVFDGANPPYKRSDSPNPLSLYGKQKAKAEKEIRQVNPKATIARVPLMFGANGPTSNNMLSGMIDKWKAGETLQLFTDEYRTPADGRSVAQGLYMAAAHPGTILHLGGSERVSRYDFGLRVADTFGLPKWQLKPLLQSELTLPAPRPKDVSLNSSASITLGYTPTPIVKSLLALAANWV